MLAAHVTNRDGAVVCPKGFCLTEEAIERLERAGIEAVIVEGRGAHNEPDYAKRISDLEARFAGVEDPVMNRLKATVERVLRDLAAQQDVEE